MFLCQSAFQSVLPGSCRVKARTTAFPGAADGWKTRQREKCRSWMFNLNPTVEVAGAAVLPSPLNATALQIAASCVSDLTEVENLTLCSRSEKSDSRFESVRGHPRPGD